MATVIGGVIGTALGAAALAIVAAADAHAQYRARPVLARPDAGPLVVGHSLQHTIRPGETLLDIARSYDLGITKLQAYHPDLNPWVLEAGNTLRIPRIFILPPARGEGIVINVPELRLYYFDARRGTVSIYPVTVGEKPTPTPLGRCRIVGREINPYWNVPPRLQYKYKETSIPPGDDNPIGKHWLALSRPRYGIHGTDNPWSVGRVISNGCIRLYPEDVERLFEDAPDGTIVDIIYRPLKFGFRDGLIFIEVHEDIYGKIRNMEWHARAAARRAGVEDFVDWEKVQIALKRKSGVPVPVGALPEGGESETVSPHR